MKIVDPLPEIYQTDMSAGQLEQLFCDIETCAVFLGASVKSGAQQRTTFVSVDLTEARQRLSSGQVRGIQLRYLYEGTEWWDTILKENDRYKVTRISHKFE